jgi:hypothetical protein
LFVVARARDLKTRSLARAVIHRRAGTFANLMEKKPEAQASLCPSPFDTFTSESQGAQPLINSYYLSNLRRVDTPVLLSNLLFAWNHVWL